MNGRSLAFVAVLVLCGVAAAWAGDAVVHMTASVPDSLREPAPAPAAAPAQPRFAQTESESESESEGESESESESDKDRDWDWENLKEANARENWVTRSVDKTIPGYKPKLNEEYQTISEQQFYKLDVEDERATSEPDTVMEESTDTWKQSARCLMHCANSVGLCTRANKKGCACAAGCQCNRGEASATCCQHCHPANPVDFVYGYHDTGHLSPHIWQLSVGEVLTDYSLVRECLAGCAHRGKCKPRFCPRHPKGGYKCNECKRMAFLPRSGKPHSKYVKYSCGSKPKPKPKRRAPRVRVTHHHHHDVMDSWGHITHHHHHHTVERVPNYRFQQQHEQEQEQENEHEGEESDSDVVMQGDLEMEDDEEHPDVHMMDADTPVVAEADAAPIDADEEPQTSGPALIESEAGAAPRKYPFGYGYEPGVTTHRHHGHIVEVPVAMTPRRQRVPSGLVEDPLMRKMDCNYYDCTKADSSAVSPVGSLNPVEPYVNVQEPRTTTFSTVPDLLQQRAHTDVVITA